MLTKLSNKLQLKLKFRFDNYNRKCPYQIQLFFKVVGNHAILQKIRKICLLRDFNFSLTQFMLGGHLLSLRMLKTLYLVPSSAHKLKQGSVGFTLNHPHPHKPIRQPKHKLATPKLGCGMLKLVWAWNSSAWLLYLLPRDKTTFLGGGGWWLDCNKLGLRKHFTIPTGCNT